MSDDEEIKKVNISIRLKTHKRAKLISVLKNITLNDYLADAIEKAVDEDKELIKNLIEDEADKDE